MPLAFGRWPLVSRQETIGSASFLESLQCEPAKNPSVVSRQHSARQQELLELRGLAGKLLADGSTGG
jgi:hypothetical protein